MSGFGSVGWMTYWFERKVMEAAGESVQPTKGSIGAVQDPDVVPVVPLTGRFEKVWFPAVANTVSESESTLTLSSEGSLFTIVIEHWFMWPAPLLVHTPNPVQELGSAQSVLLLQLVFGETHVLKMLTPWPCALVSAGKARNNPNTIAAEPRTLRTVAEARNRVGIIFLRKLGSSLGSKFTGQKEPLSTGQGSSLQQFRSVKPAGSRGARYWKYPFTSRMKWVVPELWPSVTEIVPVGLNDTIALFARV